MSNITKYDVKLVERPQIKATAKLDLSTPQGKDILRIETEKVLINHAKTLAKLANS